MIYHSVILKALEMKDQLGVVCSGLCVIHCLASPVILALGLSGALASLFTQELFHQVIIVPVVILILLTLPHAYRRKKSIALVVVGLTGASLLVSALIFDEKYEALLSLVGGGLVITFHVMNLLLQRKISHYQQDEKEVLFYND